MLRYSGEFVVPGDTPGQTLHEHLARYRFASTHITGKKVLDIACGTGYGVASLARGGAQCAIGVDISRDALGFAKTQYASSGAHYVRADVRAVPFASGSFDVITSFETIEHIPDPMRFLSECRRLLRPGGVLICSSPNRRVYSWGRSKPFNPYHVREFTGAEFRHMLERSIGGQVRMFTQHTMSFRQRIAYELWHLDIRLPALTPWLERLRASATSPSAQANDPERAPASESSFGVGLGRSTPWRPATFFVAVCEAPLR